MPDAMEAEFGTVAAWTHEAVLALGDDHAVPAGCRGSGSPSSLRWLADQLDLRSGERMLDDGAGVGGPAAWLAEQVGVRAVCAEPSAQATTACAQLFGLPVVQAESAALPFADASFDAAWCLGVLCTVPDRQRALRELRRVLRPGGRLGLLVFAAEGPVHHPVPEGNSFPLRSGLPSLLTAAGFEPVAEIAAAGLPATDEGWARRADAVEDFITRGHAEEPPWQQAQEQQAKVTALLDGGEITAVLVHATCR